MKDNALRCSMTLAPACVVMMALGSILPLPLQGADLPHIDSWPNWMGPNRDGISRESGRAMRAVGSAQFRLLRDDYSQWGTSMAKKLSGVSTHRRAM